VCEDIASEGLLACFNLYVYCMCMDMGTRGKGFGCTFVVVREGCIDGLGACILVYEYWKGDRVVFWDTTPLLLYDYITLDGDESHGSHISDCYYIQFKVAKVAPHLRSSLRMKNWVLYRRRCCKTSCTVA
jgi:hypothetical protein